MMKTEVTHNVKNDEDDVNNTYTVNNENNDD